MSHVYLLFLITVKDSRDYNTGVYKIVAVDETNSDVLFGLEQRHTNAACQFWSRAWKST